jgi:DNA-directed RNA polymerase subunit alpha
VSQDVLDTMIGSKSAQADPKAAAEQARTAGELFETGERQAALDMMRKAIRLDSDNEELHFKFAYMLDLIGMDDEAFAIYEQLASGARPHVNALLNLAVIYEDDGNYNAAERCLRQILETNPNHDRARMFMKDVQGSRDMYYDEEHVRDIAKRSAMLDIPVTDFELSVRARNCLKKMNIRTLGDLLRISESELLSYKNFGETSLVEIRAMLAQKGLRLGQGAEGQFGRGRREIYEQLRGKAPDSILNKPIAVLDLSVRARKALQMLNIHSIGDLAMRTEAELMGVKNFGQTSLDEIKQKLADFGLALRSLD